MIRKVRSAAAVAFCYLAWSGIAAGAEVSPAPAVPPDLQFDASNEYRIGPGDTLNVFVWNHPDLSITAPVRPDGLLSTPLAENTVAAGRTPAELARELERVLAEYIRNPKVNVIVTAFVGSLSQIRVVGQVVKPQSLPFRSGMTALDVMIAVGGLAPFAAGNRARIVRGVPPNQQKIPVRLGDILNKGAMKFNVVMRPGDVLIIPESRF